MPHVHNGLHEYARLLDAAARAIGEKSGAQDFSGIERFGETLTPVMDLWSLPEWALLRGESLCAGRQFVAAVPAEAMFGQLFNPATSGVIVVLDQITAQLAANAATYDLWVTATAAGTVAPSNVLDSRHVGFNLTGQGTRAQFRAGTSAAAFGVQAIDQDSTGVNVRAVHSGPIVLTPGFGVTIEASVVNVAGWTTARWVERPLLPTENRA